MKFCSSFSLVALLVLFTIPGCGDSSSRDLTSSNGDENPFANSSTTVQAKNPKPKSKLRSTRTVTKRRSVKKAASNPQPRHSPEITNSYGLVGEQDNPGVTKKTTRAAPERKKTSSDPLLGQLAPDIEIMMIDGGTLNPRAHRSSKVLMLVFWTSYNPLCKKELPILQRIAKEYSKRNVELLAVNDGENHKTIQAFLDERKLKIPVGIDLEQEVATAFNINQLPFLAIIDKRGTIQSIHKGFISTLYEKVTRDLNAVLSGEDIHKQSQKQ